MPESALNALLSLRHLTPTHSQTIADVAYNDYAQLHTEILIVS